jgi:predicted GH43/DUF377 family glycosyl hydrolase
MKRIIAGVVVLNLLILSGCNTGTLQNKSEPGATDKWAMTGFVKVDSINPILEPSSYQIFFCPVSKKEVRWEERNVLNPSAIVKDGKVYLIYRAQDNERTSRLGLAVSEDGLHFKKQPAPVFFPEIDIMMQYEWKGGVEDPRVIEGEDSTYIMTYTSYDGKTARLCLATSKDLTSWVKQGLVLRDGKYRDTWSKSGAIVSKLEGGKIIAAKIKDKYWMYFGDTDLFMATSDDLIHWEVAENEESKRMISVLHPRAGYFDSRLVEPGPFALVQDNGILLIYNGSNASNFNDPDLPKYTYAAGQVLFDKEKPFKLIDRMDGYFIHPDKPYERTGEVNEVCFVEGLVYFRDQWLLYYGTADSRIAVAVKKQDSNK